MSAGDFSQFLTALGQNESGNNYGFVSSLGYLGRYQFGEEALKAVGFYAGDDGTGAIDFIGAWTDKAAGFGVHDKASFLASPAAQDAAAQAWFGQVWSDVTSLHLQDYVGQTVGGTPITASGLIAGAHLVGVWALKDFLTSGGADLPRDGYGTSVAEYVGRFGGFDTPYAPGGGAAAAPAGNTPTDGADTLTGGAGTDIIHGQAGDDLIQGGGAFDDLQGNTGNDTIHGGDGGDWVVGGQGQDLLYGDAGADVVLGNLGDDTQDGGDGADILRGGQGNDSLSGGAGDDWISGDRGDDTEVGGPGADVFHVFDGSGTDRVLDFHAAEGDRIFVLPGESWTAAQVGSDVVVTVGEAHMTLVDVQLSTLPDGWIF